MDERIIERVVVEIQQDGKEPLKFDKLRVVNGSGQVRTIFIQHDAPIPDSFATNNEKYSYTCNLTPKYYYSSFDEFLESEQGTNVNTNRE